MEGFRRCGLDTVRSEFFLVPFSHETGVLGYETRLWATEVARARESGLGVARKIPRDTR
jgi:hypothetical protein